jgi:hypothetical protein
VIRLYWPGPSCSRDIGLGRSAEIKMAISAAHAEDEHFAPGHTPENNGLPALAINDNNTTGKFVNQRRRGRAAQ